MAAIPPLMVLIQTVMLEHDLYIPAYLNGLVWALMRTLLRMSMAPKIYETMQPKDLDSDVGSELTASAPYAIVEFYNSHVSFYMAFRTVNVWIAISSIVLINLFDVASLVYTVWKFRQDFAKVTPSSVNILGESHNNVDVLSNGSTVLSRSDQSLPVIPKHEDVKKPQAFIDLEGSARFPIETTYPTTDEGFNYSGEISASPDTLGATLGDKVDRMKKKFKAQQFNVNNFVSFKYRLLLGWDYTKITYGANLVLMQNENQIGGNLFGASRTFSEFTREYLQDCSLATLIIIGSALIISLVVELSIRFCGTVDPILWLFALLRLVSSVAFTSFASKLVHGLESSTYNLTSNGTICERVSHSRLPNWLCMGTTSVCIADEVWAKAGASTDSKLESFSTTFTSVVVEFYNMHVTCYLAFRSFSLWAAMLLLSFINILDVSALVYNAWIYRKGLAKVDKSPRKDVDIDDQRKDEEGVDDECGKPEQRISVVTSPILAESILKQLRFARERTKLLEERLQLRQSDIESRVKISRFLFVAKMCGILSACILFALGDSAEVNSLITSQNPQILFSAGLFELSDLLPSLVNHTFSIFPSLMILAQTLLLQHRQIIAASVISYVWTPLKFLQASTMIPMVKKVLLPASNEHSSLDIERGIFVIVYSIVAIEIYNGHVMYYLAFRAGDIRMSIASIICINLFDMFVIMVEAYLFRKEKKKVADLSLLEGLEPLPDYSKGEAPSTDRISSYESDRRLVTGIPLIIEDYSSKVIFPICDDDLRKNDSKRVKTGAINSVPTHDITDVKSGDEVTNPQESSKALVQGLRSLKIDTELRAQKSRFYFVAKMCGLANACGQLILMDLTDFSNFFNARFLQIFMESSLGTLESNGLIGRMPHDEKRRTLTELIMEFAADWFIASGSTTIAIVVVFLAFLASMNYCDVLDPIMFWFLSYRIAMVIGFLSHNRYAKLLFSGLESELKYSLRAIMPRQVIINLAAISTPISFIVWALIVFAASQHPQNVDGQCVTYPRILFFVNEIVTGYFSYQGLAPHHIRIGMTEAQEKGETPSLSVVVTAWLLGAFFLSIASLTMVFIPALMILIQTVMLENGLIIAAYFIGIIWTMLRFLLRASVAPGMIKAITSNSRHETKEIISAVLPVILVEFYNSHVSFYMAFRSVDSWMSYAGVILINSFDVIALLFNAHIYRREEARTSKVVDVENPSRTEWREENDDKDRFPAVALLEEDEGEENYSDGGISRYQTVTAYVVPKNKLPPLNAESANVNDSISNPTALTINTEKENKETFVVEDDHEKLPRKKSTVKHTSRTASTISTGTVRFHPPSNILNTKPQLDSGNLTLEEKDDKVQPDQPSAMKYVSNATSRLNAPNNSLTVTRTSTLSTAVKSKSDVSLMSKNTIDSRAETVRKNLESRITKVVHTTRSIQRKLTPRQLDIEQRANLSRYVFVSKLCGLSSACILLVCVDFDSMHALIANDDNNRAILFHSSIGYVDLKELLARYV
ncbi:hypothetical protein HDU76_003911 [Blyttiomyces sp. JEL0837]|nr:hypothetical protein HDU76_003911 [Blyttiomyces sp. JEL0837]